MQIPGGNKEVTGFQNRCQNLQSSRVPAKASERKGEFYFVWTAS